MVLAVGYGLSCLTQFTTTYLHHIENPSESKPVINRIVLEDQRLLIIDGIPAFNRAEYGEFDDIKNAANNPEIHNGVFSVDEKKIHDYLMLFYNEGDNLMPYGYQNYTDYAAYYPDFARALNHSYISTDIKKEFAQHALKALKKIYDIEKQEVKTTYGVSLTHDDETQFYQTFFDTYFSYYNILREFSGQDLSHIEYYDEIVDFWHFFGKDIVPGEGYGHSQSYLSD